MAPITMRFSTAEAVKSLNLVTRRERDRVRQAVRRTRRALAVEIKQRGDSQIRAAGNFGSDWTDAFEVRERGEATDTHVIEIGFNQNKPFGIIHETGGVIDGKPLLWIPLPWTHLRNVWASRFPGKLFRVNREGKNPLLFSVTDKQAKYVGVPFVTIKPRFHIRDMVFALVPPRFVQRFTQYWARER